MTDQHTKLQISSRDRMMCANCILIIPTTRVVGLYNPTCDSFGHPVTQIVAWNTNPCDRKHSCLLLLLGAIAGNHLSLVNFLLQIPYTPLC
jgi:hypothetical protein